MKQKLNGNILITVTHTLGIDYFKQIRFPVSNMLDLSQAMG